MRVCIVGASGKLGTHMVGHALDRGYEVVAVCREQSVAKLADFDGRSPSSRARPTTATSSSGRSPAATASSSSSSRAACTAMRPGRRRRSRLRRARSTTGLLVRVAHHRDGQDVYTWKLKALVNIGGRLARLARFADLDDQVEATRRVFASDTRWTVVRGSRLEEGASQGLPSGAATSATPSSKATSRAASTSPCSWSRRSKTTTSSTRRPRSSAARVRQRSPTPEPSTASIVGPTVGTPASWRGVRSSRRNPRSRLPWAVQRRADGPRSTTRTFAYLESAARPPATALLDSMQSGTKGFLPGGRPPPARPPSWSGRTPEEGQSSPPTGPLPTLRADDRAPIADA